MEEWDESYLSSNGREEGCSDGTLEPLSELCVAAGAENCEVHEKGAQKLSKADQLMVNHCSYTFAKAKACILLLKHCRVVEREVNRFCFEESLAWVLEVLGKKMLNKYSNIQAKQAIQDAVKG